MDPKFIASGSCFLEMTMKIYLKPALILLPIVVGLISLYYYKNYQKSETRADIKMSGVQSLVFEDLSESLLDLKGQKIVVNADQILIVHFWASWCGPCVEELPELIDLVEKKMGKIFVLAVSGDSDRREMEVFLKSFPKALATKGFSIFWDEGKTLTNLWKVDKLPESYIYSSVKSIENSDEQMRTRNLEKRISGAVKWLSPDATQYLESLN